MISVSNGAKRYLSLISYLREGTSLYKKDNFFSRSKQQSIVYDHGRRLCSNRFQHGSTTISYPQCSLTFMRGRYLHRCRGLSFAKCAYVMSAVGIDVVSVRKLFAYRVVSTVSTDIMSSHTNYCRIAYGITR